jgi:hypothetical protein
MKKLLTLFLTLFLIATNAYAEWKSFVVFNDGQAHFYDKSSIKRNGDKIRVWSYVNFSPDNKVAKSGNMASSRQLEEFDCVNETTKTLAFQYFTKLNLEGDTTNVANPDSTIQYIVPNSAMSILMNLVCKK